MVVTHSVPVQMSGNACGNTLENHSEFVLKRVLKFFGIGLLY